MEASQPAASTALSDSHVWRIAFGGGAVLAVVTVALCLAFGNLLLVLMSAMGLEFLVAGFVLYLITTLLRWMAMKAFARGAELERPFTAMEKVRFWFYLTKFGALNILAVGWLAVAFLAPAHQAVLRDAFFFAFFGLAFIVAIPLHVLDNVLEMLRAMARRTARP